MGFLFDEKQLVNDNIFLHEERINSQYSRFLESSPSYVTYYNINNIETTTDTGFGGVERILGANSPIRFNKVKDFPIYGLEQIVLSLDDELQGLDSSYEGEAIILPNTIKPLPNDMFTISYLSSEYIFMVTAVAYDTIRSKNFYKISFTVKSLYGEHKDHLERQTIEKFNCLVDNIGTKEKVLLRDDDVDQLIALNEIYTTVANQYKLLFFNKKYNCFAYTNGSNLIYDRYLSEFINKTKIFNDKKKLETIYLTNEDPTPTMMLEYHNSFYRAVEAKKKSIIKPYPYSWTFITNFSSIFAFYRDGNVRSIKFDPNGIMDYIRPEVLNAITTPSDDLNENVMIKTIVGFFNEKINTIYELNRVDLREYPEYMGYDHETYVLVPVLLYILRHYYNKFMTTT